MHATLRDGTEFELWSPSDEAQQTAGVFPSPPACIVGLEASGSAPHWAHALIRLGYEARMTPRLM